MRKLSKPKININRKTIFAAGVVIGAGVVVIVLKDRIVWNPHSVTIVSKPEILDWLIKEGHVVDFVTDAGTFVLTPPAT